MAKQIFLSAWTNYPWFSKSFDIKLYSGSNWSGLDFDIECNVFQIQVGVDIDIDIEQVNAENKMKNKISIIDYILFQVDANILRYQNMKF